LIYQLFYLSGLKHPLQAAGFRFSIGAAGRTSLEEVERALIELAMMQANNKQTYGARLLDISRDALRYKLKKFGLVHCDEPESAEESPKEVG